MREFSPADARHMRRALQLARRGRGHTAPNPMVGAVVVRDGAVVGEGWHRAYGGPHAEVRALAAPGGAARGATVYVTLEPCNHHGKTPPCTDALLAADVARVVVAVADPFPAAAGGAARLRAAGVRVDLGLLEADARELNAPFLHAALGAGRPWVTLKLALSLDGALADHTHGPGWLTGPAARLAVHRMRAEADAVAVGIGTALADDPALTVRGARAPRVPPLRVVFDRTLRLPTGSRLARTAREVPVAVVTEPAPDPARAAALEALGVRVVPAPGLAAGLGALRREHGVRALLVEGGAGLAGALWGAGLVDRLVIFQAPVVLGADALRPFTGVSGLRAATAPRLLPVARRAVGADLQTVYAVHPAPAAGTHPRTGTSPGAAEGACSPD
ncbi:bifunctional diaminohydroxyphosphoribosylaminopyrimidine deaminase/5-amino-6-(5-phosphoribosylamino)uracil reductase RibD [Roseisolibacter sp. H3M3-2]|uniref:bifunctional diaminohydroxyphosphoribosylaminopyrimidine deaminase/5-amino-6-(5-phosphoribosylamino)uracil reductase RibD n=1 Tax=Roseisolibacter sp. H3M3-2 TaxID=3031323 RepID=UPI0023D97F63|nr:bifunctional diaminohydroxyphosphoribosylaminopyrimidine deaminase/5-amino-6-(5-phosphoribosylamino)uracil reductase RibD [Roseisolibacter sp. H3M3-2]MDF1503334.1 bifunctional diaminohydroxyphosphoribosylaminopyrimidine deaminase/5-amino-6-(5-phosphoribosylamino)uracil reductase RibD [Roseisolibacter sp. H3M3-2]